MQPACVEILCDALKKEVEEALTSNVGPSAPSCAVGRETAPQSGLSLHMQGQYFQERSFLGHMLTPSPMFAKSRKDPLGLKRYAAYVAISGFPQLTSSSVSTCHVSHAQRQCIGQLGLVWPVFFLS